MPKKHSSKGVGRSKNAIPFKSSGIFLTTTTSGFTGITLDLSLQALSNRLVTMGNLYKKWRLVSLFVRVWSELIGTSFSSPIGGTIAVGWLGSPVSNVGGAVNSINDVSELVISRTGPLGKLSLKVPSTAIQCARSSPWLLTNVSSGTPQVFQYVAGSLVLVCNLTFAPASFRLWMELTGLVDLSEPTDPTVNSRADDWPWRMMSELKQDSPVKPIVVTAAGLSVQEYAATELISIQDGKVDTVAAAEKIPSAQVSSAPRRRGQDDGVDTGSECDSLAGSLVDVPRMDAAISAGGHAAPVPDPGLSLVHFAL